MLALFCCIILYERSGTTSFSWILIAKELIQKKIRNNDELKLFEETLDRCEASVLVVTAQGEQYDLKDPAQRYIGITAMLQGEGLNEPELFASSYKDEMKFFDYLNRVEALAA